MKRTSGYFISVANNRLPRENSQKSFIYVTYNMVYLNFHPKNKLLNNFHCCGPAFSYRITNLTGTDTVTDLPYRNTSFFDCHLKCFCRMCATSHCIDNRICFDSNFCSILLSYNKVFADFDNFCIYFVFTTVLSIKSCTAVLYKPVVSGIKAPFISTMVVSTP